MTLFCPACPSFCGFHSQVMWEQEPHSGILPSASLLSPPLDQPSRQKARQCSCWRRWVFKALHPGQMWTRKGGGSWDRPGGAGPRSRRVCSQPDAVADGHVVFWLHQPEAVAAEVKLGDLRIRVDQLQVKACQREEHESAERRCGRCEGAGAWGAPGIRQQNGGFLLSLTAAQSTGVTKSPRAPPRVAPSAVRWVRGLAPGDGM